MKTIILRLLICMLALPGCNLAYRAPIEAAVEPLPIDLSALPTQQESTQRLKLENETPASQLITVCSPRSDWRVYVVVKGDTLSGIALRFKSTIDELVAANCLENAHLIIVHQHLYVPQRAA